MDAQSKEKLAVLLAKDKNDLTDADKAFLKARKSYISVQKQSEMTDILGGETVDVPYKKLQARAKELGLKYVGVSKEALKESIIVAENKETEFPPKG